MNLLGAALYDPTGGAAVSKVTTSLLAMTALDTANLRIAFTIPSHGMVTVKMSGVHHGSTTVAQVLFGVLEGATLRGRMVANKDLLQTAIATSRLRFDVEYTITGLTPGAVNWDAAYGVEIVSSAGGAIKYGGPNNTTTDDAHGAFRFEVWDPRPVPTATPGAANGLQIAGANAATTYATLTSTGAFSVNGVSAVSQTGDAFARLGAPAGASLSADVAAVKVDTAAIKVKTDFLPSATAGAAGGVQIAGANAATTYATLTSTGAFSVNGVSAVSQTGDAYARLGAPAGLSVSADVAAVKSDTATIKTSTNNLPSDPADESLIIAATDAIMSRIGAAGAGLTALGDTRIANLDATVSSRTKPADTQAAVTVVNGLAAGVITATSIAADAITDAKVAADVTIASVTGAVGSVTGNVGGNVVGSVASVTAGVTLAASAVQAIWDALTSALTTVGSIGKLLVTNLDALISSRMATYTQPTGFLAATFPGTVASPTNITAASGVSLAASQHVIVDSGTVTTLTNLPAITAGWLTATGIAASALNGKGDWNIGKTGYTLTQTFPTNFSAMALTAGGAVTAGTVSDKTGYALTAGYDSAKTAAQAGDAMTLTSGERTAVANEVEAQIIDDTDSEKVLTAITDKIASVNPSLGALTLAAIGSQVRTELTTELGRIDVATSTRMAGSSYTAPPSAASNAAAVRTELATELARVDVATSTRLPTASYTAPDNTVAALIGTPAVSVAADIAAVKADTGAILTDTGTTLDAALAVVDANVDAIKAKTDSLAFTAGGKVDANVKAVNDTPINGGGTVLDPWGP